MKIPILTNFINRKALSIATKAFNPLGRLTSPDFWTQAWYVIFGDKNYKGYVMQGYAANPFVYMVISRIAQDISRLVYYVNNNGKETLTGDVFKIYKAPNATQNWQEFIEVVMLNYLTGEVIIVDENSVGFENKIVSLKVLSNQWATPRENGLQELTGWDYVEKGKTTFYPIERAIHIKYANIVYNDGERAHRGFSPLEPLTNVYESSNSIFTAENAIFQNGGVLGMLTNDSDLPMLPKEKEQVEEDWRKRNAGAANFGKIKITNSKLRYLQIGVTPKDLQMNVANLAKLRVICAAFNVDSKIFGDPASTTYNNMAEANKAYYLNRIIPTSTYFLNKFNAYVQKKTGSDQNIIFDESKIDALKEVNKTLSDKVIQEVGAGILTKEQGLALLYPDLKYAQPNI